MRSRGIWALALIAILIAVIALLWRSGDELPAAAEAPASAPAIARVRAPVEVTRAMKAVRPPIEAALPPPEPPIIDSITVEKPRVCADEENLITVHAHTPGGTDDAYLHYFIVSDTGQSVPLRLHSRESETHGTPRQITVFGRDNVATTVDLPPYEVMDCEPDRALFIGHRAMANTEGDYEFLAKVVDIGATTPFQPVRYHWAFGDGTTADTTAPTVEHDWSHRAQDSLYAQLLVSCTAIGADGETVTGRSELQLVNIAFEELQHKGMVRLFTTLEPRFPIVNDKGVVEQGVHVWHLSRQPVTITRITKAETIVGATDPEPAEEIDPTKVLGTDTIPPGDGITAHVTLDAVAHPETLMISYWLEGVSADGYAVHGSFAVMRPPDRPDKGNSRPVLDAVMKQKILRARELLHQPYVTDEDLLRLDRQGAFADIVRDPHAPPTPPEPAPPR